MAFMDLFIRRGAGAVDTQTTLIVKGRVVGLALSCLLAGCHQQKQTADGSMVSPSKPAAVDNSWLNAARSCWPDLARNGYSSQQIRVGLVHHLGAAFPAYAALGTKIGEADLSMPITTVLAPNSSLLKHSQMPILTRGQAVAGTPAQGALVASTNGNAPPDALCAIQSGIPQGFSK